MPLQPAFDQPEPVFVDRIDQARLVRRVIEDHRRRLDTDEIDGRTYRNVLVFYGPGGTGKTELSRGLQRWLRDDRDELDLWGAPPSGLVDAIGRWELNDSQGGLDAYDLLLELRRTLGDTQQQWPAFDLAFTALAHGLRRPHNVELTRASAARAGWSLADVVAGAINDVATVADVAGGGLAGAGIGLVSGVLSRQRQSRRSRQLLEDWNQEGLADLVASCHAVSGSEEEVRDLAGRLAWLLTLEIDRRPQIERPLALVCVDHLERLDSYRRSGESLLHALVLHLPHVLFIMTGRNPLRWADASRTDLRRPGPRTWPVLDPGELPAGSQQHLVDFLDVGDAVELLQRRLEQVHVGVVPGLIEDLARQTAGWPLHIDAIVTLAAGRASGQRALTLEDLGGPLPAVVNRLFEDLPAAEKDVLQAACLLPYFDAQIAAIAAGQPVGAVHRFSQRSIVRHNTGSAYPHRIHDEIRQIVRDTGSEVESGWGAEDWSRRARKAMDEAERRFDQAMQDADDQAAIHALALAISIGAENSTYAPWLIRGLREVPSLMALSPLVPTSFLRQQDDDMACVLAYVRACSHPISDAKLAALEEVAAMGGAISSTAALWHMYTLRSLGRTDEAVAAGRRILETYDDRHDLYRYQLGVTFRMSRRFRELRDLLTELPSDRRGYMERYIDWRHGRLDEVPEMLEQRRDQVRSRRFQIELLGTWLVASHHAGQATREHAERVVGVATRAGHHHALRFALAVQGQLHLFDDEVVENCLEDARIAEQARGERCSEVTALLALRGWVTGQAGQLAEAQTRCVDARAYDSELIGVESLLAHLGYAVPDQLETQWLEDPSVVAERWVSIYSRIVERARRIDT